MDRLSLPAAARRATVCASVCGLILAAPASAQVTVDSQLPGTPAPAPQVPAVPEPGGVVGGANDTVGQVVGGVAGGAGGGGSASTASPTAGGGSGAPAGGGASTPTGPVAADTGRSGGVDARSGPRGGRRDAGGARSERRGDRRARPRDRRSGAAGDATGARRSPATRGARSENDEPSGVTRTLERVVEVIPIPMWIALGVLALLAAGSFGRSQVVARRARRLTAQREELLQDVGLLQQALLPEIPERLGELATSVAYRPADGPAAGGDFYDAFLLDGERVAIIVGDVSGHGRAALARTALMRYTLRAYLDAGLEPRRALKVAGKGLDDDLGGDFATVVLAVHDPARATLTYASAGHPPPLVTGSGAFQPVTALSSPPIGAGLPTGQRQTTLHLPGDAVACFFTDGLIEAKHDGELVGVERLREMLVDLGPLATADGLIDAVGSYADETPDDMAACILRPDPAAAADHVPDRLEEVELNSLDLCGDGVDRFLAACGVGPVEAAAALRSVEGAVGEFGGALLRVRVDKAGTRCEVESAAGLHDPLGAPPELDEARVRV